MANGTRKKRLFGGGDPIEGFEVTKEAKKQLLPEQEQQLAELVRREGEEGAKEKLKGAGIFEELQKRFKVGQEGTAQIGQVQKIETPKVTPTPTKMEDFSKLAQSRGFQLNEQTGEVIDPTPELIEEFNKQFTTTTPTGVPKLPQPGEAKRTGIKQVDTELDKLRKEREKTVEQTFKDFNIQKGRFEKEKGLYANYDDVNTKFEGVLNDLKGLQTEFGQDLTNEQLLPIAEKYNLSIEQVKNPTDIFNNLEFTEEGRQEKGISRAEEDIEKMTTSFERKKEDLARDLEVKTEAFNNQISDVKRQIERNLDWGVASGVWSGSVRSSGYLQGLQNIKDDGDRTVNRLNTALERMQSANEENVKRLTADYYGALENAQEDLDDNVDKLKINTGIKLNGLTDKYGVGSEELTNALNNIYDEFGTKSIGVYNDYLNSVKQIQSITDNELRNQERQLDLQQERENTRFNELLADDGAILQNSNLLDLSQQVRDGQLSFNKFQDLKNIMQTSIIKELGQFGAVEQDDIIKISSLLENGNSPLEIMSEMRQLPKFVSEEIAPEKRFKTVSEKAKIFDVEAGEFVQQTGTGVVTQDYGAISPLSVDNVKLSDGTIGTPGIDIDGAIGDPITSTINGKVVEVIESNSGLGNQVIIEDLDGNRHMFNHMDDFNVQKGQQISTGDQLGTIGNTGSVIKLAGGDGSHLDYRVQNKEGEWINPKLFTQPTRIQPVGFDDSLIPLYKKSNEGKLTTADRKAIAELGKSTGQFLQEALSFKNEGQNLGSQFASEVLGIIQELESNVGNKKLAFVGGIPLTSSRDYKRTFDQFRSKLALNNLVDLKSQGATFGALSDNELRFITDASTKLDLGASEEGFLDELNLIKQKLQKAVREPKEQIKEITQITTPEGQFSTKSGFQFDIDQKEDVTLDSGIGSLESSSITSFFEE